MKSHWNHNIKAKAAKCFAATRSFLTSDVWDAELGALPWLRRRLLGAIRIACMVTRGFRQDECGIRAASLTFISLLSFVPVLALALSVVRVVSYDDSLRDNTKEFVRAMLSNGTELAGVSAPGAPLAAVAAPAGAADVAAENSADEKAEDDVDIFSSGDGFTVAKIEKLIDSGFDKVEGINFGALGGLGLLFFIWTVIGVMGSVELAFNKVWGVQENRSLARKFSDYLSVLIICPLLLAAASSLPVIAIAKQKINAADAAIPQLAGFPILNASWVLFLLTLAFTFMLRFMPNTKVKLLPGLAGGFVTAVGFAAWLRICLALQIGVVKYDAFFGGFSMLPILLSWVFVSWEIILFGAEFSYAAQNFETYPKERGWRMASWKAKLLLAAALMREAVARTENGDGILRLREFNKTRRVSARLLREVAYELDRAGFIVAIVEESEEYALRRPPAEITLGAIARRMLESGVGPSELGISGLNDSAAAALLDKALGEALGAGIKNLEPKQPHK